MKMKDYLAASGRTVASTFYANLVAPRFVYEALAGFVRAGEHLDKTKKALFYGRDTLSWTQFEDGFNAPSTLDATEPDIIHAILGVATEAVEMVELLEANVLKGTPIDPAKLMDESGDILWYLALLYRKLGVTFEDVAEKNIEKLKVRFPEKFTEQLANVRDTAAEDAVFSTTRH